MRLDEISPEDFETLPGNALPLRLGATELRAEVCELRRLRAHALRSGTPFAVVLRLPPETSLQQGTHLLIHPTLGPLELFMVPIAPDAHGQRFEITFN